MKTFKAAEDANTVPYNADLTPKSPYTKLAGDDPAIPCGLVAKSTFNDTFKLYKKGSSGRTQVEIEEKGIAWASDLQYKFKNIDKSLPEGKTWDDVQW